jgi:hypothetical protein
VEAHESVGLVRRLPPAVGAAAAATAAAAYASLCPWKDSEIVVHGAALTCPAFQALLHAALRALINELGVRAFNASVHNIQLPASRRQAGGGGGTSAARPVVARIVSRGQPSAVASDFGGLEVFGGASIGHTDPWRVAEALGRALGGG